MAWAFDGVGFRSRKLLMYGVWWRLTEWLLRTYFGGVQLMRPKQSKTRVFPNRHENPINCCPVTSLSCCSARWTSVPFVGSLGRSAVCLSPCAFRKTEIDGNHTGGGVEHAENQSMDLVDGLRNRCAGRCLADVSVTCCSSDLLCERSGKHPKPKPEVRRS